MRVVASGSPLVWFTCVGKRPTAKSALAVASGPMRSFSVNILVAADTSAVAGGPSAATVDVVIVGAVTAAADAAPWLFVPSQEDGEGSAA